MRLLASAAWSRWSRPAVPFSKAFSPGPEAAQCPTCFEKIDMFGIIGHRHEALYLLGPDFRSPRLLLVIQP